MKTFNLTEQHIKLLRRAYVHWHRAEAGAPTIDPKRPYGNSNVEEDVAEILGLPYDSEDDNNTDKLLQLHQETETALQIVLCTGSFEPGMYVMQDYRRTLSWVKVEGDNFTVEPKVKPSKSPKMLKDGEKKEFKFTSGIKVVAERVDCDTPYVHVAKRQFSMTLCDFEAKDVAEGIEKALRILPSSK